MKAHIQAALAVAHAAVLLFATAAFAQDQDFVHSPKVMLITLFEPEARAWTANITFDQEIKVRGLSAKYPKVLCKGDDVCLMTTNMGHTNAAASTMALVLSNQFDLRKTYFLITGIAGIDPDQGTLGSAAWARYLVDFGLQHEIDAREKPRSWTTGYLGIHAADPSAKPNLEYKTEVYGLLTRSRC